MKPLTCAMSDSLRVLLGYLADGQFHSGAALGRTLGISRAAVHARIQTLCALGFDCHALPGRGYRLVPAPVLLDLAQWPSEEAADTHLCLTLDSTNGEIMRRRRELPSGAVVVAEHQQAGRGRRGRDWISPPATNLYLSMLWRFEEGLEAVLGLSQAVALACGDALAEMGATAVQVKWPNDLLWHDRKLGGILIELSGQPGEPTDVVIGVGLNVSMPPQAATAIHQPWCDLHSVLGTAVDRNRLAALVVRMLRAEVARFQRHGLAPRLADWQARDRYHEQPVWLLHAPQRRTEGRVLGIDGQGALLLATSGGVERFLGGEVSMRGASA